MEWTFTQIGGDRKVLKLSGYNAPFGRPRQKPVLIEKIHVEVQTTKYPGSKAAPTRHAFGSSWEPMELSGRWMTKYNPAGATAGGIAADWIRYVQDEQQVRFSWGNVVTYTGFIQDLELARESEDEIAWKMLILVDANDDLRTSWNLEQPTSISDNTTFLAAWVSAGLEDVQPILPDTVPQFLENLDFLLGNIRGFTANLVDLVGQFQSWEQATFSTIQAIRGVTANLMTGITDARNLILTTEIDSVLALRRAENDVRWWKYQTEFDVNSLNAFAILSEMDRELEIQSRQTLNRFIDAQDGDTWERLATRAGLGIDRAADIREVNGIRFGQLPEPGVTYLVP